MNTHKVIMIECPYCHHEWPFYSGEGKAVEEHVLGWCVAKPASVRPGKLRSMLRRLRVRSS